MTNVDAVIITITNLTSILTAVSCLLIILYLVRDICSNIISIALLS